MSTQKRRIREKRNNIKVLVRSRPLLEFQNEPAWQISSTHKIECMHTKSVRQKVDKTSRRSQTDIETKFKEMTFQYQKVYYDKTTSQKIYKQQARQMVQQSLQTNKNLTLMCYGQTCSGKTFTILGEQKLPGLMPCMLRDLMIFKRQYKYSCEIRMSYFEIYNECIYDLLIEGGKKNLTNGKFKVFEDKKYGWQVSGLKIESVEIFEECIQIIEKGEKNRSYASKENHDRSSRSHTIMRIYIEKEDSKYNKSNQIFNIVDLAGSQRLSDLSKNPQQTASINKSLFQLSNVICKLSTNDPSAHIPYRDSKLTKLLECSLNGNASCLVVFCITPAVESFNETLSTLRLAKKAKAIQVEVQQENPMENWSPLERELFETKQKLSKKVAECEQLQFRLTYLTKELERLETFVDQMQNRCTTNVDLLILLDHQNFILKNLTTNESFNSSNLTNVWENKSFQSELQAYQAQFSQSLQQLYEQYTSDITHIYLKNLSQKQKKNSLNDEYLIKIEEICFKDIVFDQNMRNQCKFESVEKLIQQLEKNVEKENSKNKQNIIGSQNKSKTDGFIDMVKQYHQHLSTFLRSQSKSQQSFSRLGSSSMFDRTKRLKPISISSENLSIEQVDSRLQSIECKTLYAWGCSKDGRVFKGTQALPGITLLSKEEIGTIKKIATSYNHNLLVNEKGKLYGWGKNNFNQVSTKDTPSHSLPRQISFKEKAKSIATGWGHSMVLTEGGKVYTWGYGENGQLGHGNLQNVSKPQLIDFKNQFIEVYAGHSHSAILDASGELYTFGFNKDYRCLVKSQEMYLSTPTKVLIANIKEASLGVSHSIILTQQRYAFCGGIGSNGQLGRQLTLEIPGCEFIDVESRKFEDGDEKFEKVCPLLEFELCFEENQHIIKVKCGQNITYVLTNFGNLYFCGKNFNKKLSQNIYNPKLLLSNICNFSIGSRHGFAFEYQTNKVYGWGFNMYNQLGNNLEKDIIVPQLISGLSAIDLVVIQCGFIHTIALRK